MPVNNNHIENLIRPWAMGRQACPFAGSELTGPPAAVVMSLGQSARLNGHAPWVYLKDALMRLPTHLHSRIENLPPQSLASSALRRRSTFDSAPYLSGALLPARIKNPFIG